MVTIKDIARKLGVSPSTVSKSLNDYSEIGRETAELVKQTAREMGYMPNAAAQQLKTNRSHNLGVLFVDDTRSGLTHEYFSVMLNGFKDQAERLGYDITFISKSIGKMPMSYLEHCRRRNCDGVAIACVDFNDPTVLELMCSDIPAVTVDYTFDNRSSVLSDNIQGMRDLVRYIHKMGHRRIALIHGENTVVTQRRVASFFRTCSDLGIEIDERLVRESRYHDIDQCAAITRELLAMDPRPTCILYPDDYSCLGGLAEIEKAGLSIPNDISVTGYDGIAMSRVLRPQLTTVSQDAAMIGRRAADLLVEAIDSPRTFLAHTVSVPAKLVTGNSVKKLL